MFGEEGKDGKKGTPDDIANPIPEIEAKLARAQGQGAAANAAAAK